MHLDSRGLEYKNGFNKYMKKKLAKKNKPRRFAYFALAFIFLLSVISASIVIKGKGASAGTKIDDASNFDDQAGDRQVVRTSSGTLYAFMNNCGMWKSSNESSWTEQDSANKPSCSQSTNRTPSIAIDSNNLIHITFLTYTTYAAVVYKTFDTATDSFGVSAEIGTSTDAFWSTSLAVDSNNKPHIAYSYYEFDGISTFDSYVMYVNKTSGSWGSPIFIAASFDTFDAEQYDIGSIAINEDNIPEIIYIHSSFNDLSAAQGDANNATSFTVTLVDNSVVNIYSSLGIDSIGNTWIAYVDGGTSYVTLVKNNDTDLWSEWLLQTTNSKVFDSAGIAPSLAINGTDVYVFYSSNTTTNAVYDRYNGSWLGETTLDTRSTRGSIGAKWSYYHNNQGSIKIDYLYSDGTDVYWNKLNLVSNSIPDAPTLSAPASGATAVSTIPQFQLRTTDADNDYLRYEIVVYQSDCSTVVRTIDQTASQTGWSGQDSQFSTAYVGSSTIASSTMAVHNYQTPALAYSTTYCWKARAKDPGGSDTWGSYSATQNFTTVAAGTSPSAPTLINPVNGITRVRGFPIFELRSSDANSDYLQYKIEICSTSDCSVIARTIDQSLSQAGWVNQNQNGNTAYTGSSTLSGSTIGVHTLQTTGLSANTQYWWRAYAIDPGGSNTFSAASGINSFTISPVVDINVRGGANIRGGSTVN